MEEEEWYISRIEEVQLIHLIATSLIRLEAVYPSRSIERLYLSELKRDEDLDLLMGLEVVDSITAFSYFCKDRRGRE